MNYVSKDSVAALPIRSIEGAPTRGTFLIKPMLKGDRMLLQEVHMQAGVASGRHVHSHESLIYMVKGSVRSRVGDEVIVLRAGDVGRHPAHVAHDVEALEETIFVEVKSPAPDIGKVLATGSE